MAERTGLEPATPCVTGRYSNRLNYRSTEFFFTTTGFMTGLLLNLMPGSSLLSHGETPTLPSALRRFTSEFGMGSGGTTALRPPSKFCFIRPLLRSDLICIRLKIFSHPPKQLRRCKVKPHGSLVPVSSTHRCAYTPGLSTSSSSTFLQDSQGVRENSSRGQVSCLDAFSTYLFRI